VTKHSATGVEVLAASEDDGEVWERCSPEDMKRLIDLFAQVYDFVLIDTSGGFGTFVRACVESATLTLVVTSDDVSSVRDTAAAVRRLERWQIEADRVRFIVNEESAHEGVKLRDISEAIGRQISWVLPYDRAVIESVQRGQPVVLRNRRSPATRVMTSVATLIGGVQGPRERPSFIGRVLPGRGLVG
jgi:MinD-like ATPase involved in chromosome partitioning or flagellar assembly